MNLRLKSPVLLVLCGGLFAAVAIAAEWRTLPLVQDGQIAPAWKQVGWGRMIVDGETLRTEPDEKGLGLLVYTKELFGDCQIRVVYRPMNHRANSGVHLRMDEGVLQWIGREAMAVKRNEKGKLAPDMLARMRDASEKENGAWYAVHHGFEVQIMDNGDEFHRTGSMYSYAAAAALPAAAAGQWRTMVITLRGTLIVVELDGKELSRLDSAATDLPPRKTWTEPKRDVQRPTHGYIGLQTHDPGDIVSFREVSVRPLEGR